jgi:hypothetical protein
VYTPDGKAQVLTEHDTYSTIKAVEHSAIIYERRSNSGIRRFEGTVISATRKEVILKLHKHAPENDEIVITNMEGPWRFTSGMTLNEVIEATLLPNKQSPVSIINPGIRCERTRQSIHANSLTPIILQCVKDAGHTGACHYENPSNERKQ